MPKLVLVRHGQSQWNLENRFTGWVDVELSGKGIQEAHQAGRSLKGITFSQAFTSNLKRAQDTLQIILEEIGQTKIPVTRNEALNERHYGDLQGLNKAETAKKFGEEQVHIWRRSYDIAPPKGESLKDTAARTLPYFNSKIVPLVKNGENIIIAAHGNSLRSIVMDLEKLTPDQILKYEIPTGSPIIYDMNASGKVLGKTLQTTTTG
jgi:2,3-bisphosphoglycerate-dependent phosphoglycerate mutase